MKEDTVLAVIMCLVILLLVFGGKPSIKDGIVYMMEHTEKEIK